MKQRQNHLNFQCRIMYTALAAYTRFYKICNLSKSRRQRQRERHQTKGLMSKTIAVQVRYNSLYISQPSSAKQPREMTCVFWRT